MQSVTIYSSEMSPPQYRGTLNLMFQWCTTIGIIIAQLINYGTQASPPSRPLLCMLVR